MKFRKKFWGCMLAAAIAAAAVAHLGRSGGWASLALLFNREALVDFFAMAGHSSIVLFVLAHIVANAVGVPGTLLVVVGGAVYGLWWGTLWSVVGATLGAVAAFGLARYLLYDWFERRFHHRPVVQRLNHTVCRNSLGCVLTIRFSPISPFNVVNFAFGLTSVPLGAYTAGTFIGIIPGTLAYTWLGVTGAEALSGGSLLPLGCCLLVLMLLSALPIYMRHRRASL